MRRSLCLLFCAVLLIIAPVTPSVAHAETPKNKGLLISPLRQYTSVNAGSQKSDTFTVANLTEKTITVNLSAEQFSVSDYAYDYRFSEPHNDWLKLGLTQVTLEPNVSQKIPYTLSVPKGSAPGGQYYTLFASAHLSNAGLEGTVQAATLLYVTVNGKLVQTSSLRASSIARFSFGRPISYSLDVANTGNIHYFVYVSGRLESPLVASDYTPTTHLLLPGTVRRLKDTIPAPLFPGVYKATYGYKTDSGVTAQRSAFVVFIPPWSVVAVILLAFGGAKLYQRRARHKKAKDEPAAKP